MTYPTNTLRAAACRWSLFALLAIFPLTCPADLIFEESFTYPDGPLREVSSGLWSNTSGTPTNTLEVSLQRAHLEQTDAEDMTVSLPGGPYSTTTNISIYWSLRLTVSELASGNGGYFAHLAGGSFLSRLFVVTNGAAPGAFRVGIANGASTASAIYPQDLSPHNEALVLVMYNPASGVSTLWVNPPDENAASVTASDSISASSVTRFNLRQVDKIGALFVDDLKIGTSFADVHATASPTPPVVLLDPEDQTVNEGQRAVFTALVAGTEPILFQWLFDGIPLAGATNAILELWGTGTNQAGTYRLAATNAGGFVLSAPATLTVIPASPWNGTLKVLMWNVKGNGAEDWGVDAPQVQAIGRVLTVLAPDVITFNEIPNRLTWQMTNWTAAFLPGWYLATNSGTDGFIRTVIASRFPILSSQKHFDGTSLAPYGEGNFTRDLFQARVRIPGAPEPLDVFCSHLKATGYPPQPDADKRAAEALVISNFLANVYLPTNRGALYLLTGDLNEDVLRPDTARYTTGRPIQALANAQTGLALLTPVNPVTLEDYTLSIQSTLNVRFDYVLPCLGLATNIASSQVFRSDLFTNDRPVPLFAPDSRTASDHLPVLVSFALPEPPPRLAIHGDHKLLSWETTPGEEYRILSADEVQWPLVDWTVEAASFQASNYYSSFSVVRTAPKGFFLIERIK